LLGNLVWKADVSENNVKENFIYLKNTISIYIYIYNGTPLARPHTGRHSIGRVSWAGLLAGMVASHLYS